MARNLDEPPPSKPAYFWWLLANGLALCFAIVSWAVCLDVFGHPEQPRNYLILSKLKRLPEPKRYTILDVPNGNSFSPKELYPRFYGQDQAKLDELNPLLLRNYLTNFDNAALLTYVEGDYQVLDVRKLGPKDFVEQGFAVRAQAMVKPDEFTKAAPYPVIIEYILPAPDNSTAEIIKKGDMLEIKKSPQCAAVIHVAKIEHQDDPTLCLTVIPIAYGPYRMNDDNVFQIEPPVRLQPQVEFPIFQVQK